MAAIKPPTTYKQQIEKIRSRGCTVQDEGQAIDILSKEEVKGTICSTSY